MGRARILVIDDERPVRELISDALKIEGHDVHTAENGREGLDEIGRQRRHADAEVALLLARPEGAPGGTAGLALFALPRRLKDGRRNAYRVKKPGDTGIRHQGPATIRLANPVLTGTAA